MSVWHELNEFGEVVIYDCGRLNNDTRLNREPTAFELELLEQIKSLEEEIERLRDRQ